MALFMVLFQKAGALGVCFFGSFSRKQLTRLKLGTAEDRHSVGKRRGREETTGGPVGMQK